MSASKLALSLLSALFFLITMNESTSAAGEKYSREGSVLSASIREHLIREGHCRDIQDCFKKIDSYGGHGDRVNITYYGTTDLVLAQSIIAFILAHGLEKTGGVSIKASFHRETRESQGNSVTKLKPIISLEMNK